MSPTLEASASSSGDSLSLTNHELRFRIQGSHHHGQVLCFSGPKCTIGSSLGCHLVLRSRFIAALHCLILRGEQGTLLRSFSPDTRVNGRSVEQCWLHVGDRLSIGPIDLVVMDLAAVPGSPLEPQVVHPLSVEVKPDAATVRAVRAHEHRRARQLITALRELQGASSRADSVEHLVLESPRPETDLPKEDGDASATATATSAEIESFPPTSRVPEATSGFVDPSDPWAVAAASPGPSETTPSTTASHQLPSWFAEDQRQEDTDEPSEPTSPQAAASAWDAGSAEQDDFEAAETPSLESQLQRSLRGLSNSDTSETVGTEEPDHRLLELEADPWTPELTVSPAVDESSSLEEAPQHAALSPSATAKPLPAPPTDDDEESINVYMTQLLSRLRQGDDSSPVIANEPPKSSDTTVPDSPSCPESETAPAVKSPSAAYQRRSAPEQQNDIQSLREIANQTARGAIQKSQSRRSQSSVFFWLAGGVVCSGTGGFCLLLADSLSSRLGMAGTLGLGIGMVAILRALTTQGLLALLLQGSSHADFVDDMSDRDAAASDESSAQDD